MGDVIEFDYAKIKESACNYQSPAEVVDMELYRAVRGIISKLSGGCANPEEIHAIIKKFDN